MEVQHTCGHVLIPEKKFELNVNWGVEEITIYRNIDITTVLEILMTYAECSEDEHINPKEERDCDKQDEDVQEEGDTSKILTLRSWGLSQHWKCKG